MKSVTFSGSSTHTTVDGWERYTLRGCDGRLVPLLLKRGKAGGSVTVFAGPDGKDALTGTDLFREVSNANGSIALFDPYACGENSAENAYASNFAEYSRSLLVEYEYSYFTGVLTVTKILGSRSRKLLAKVTIREISAIYPCNEIYAARIDAFGEEKTVFAASSEQSPDLYAALWTDESGVKHALYFEPNEKALRILKYYNVTALSALQKNP